MPDASLNVLVPMSMLHADALEGLAMVLSNGTGSVCPSAAFHSHLPVRDTPLGDVHPSGSRLPPPVPSSAARNMRVGSPLLTVIVSKYSRSAFGFALIFTRATGAPPAF